MENLSKKITIKDIAYLAGVSIGTVDRVIHNRGEVSLKTKDKILKITESLNYSPDILASALASKKKFRIAIIMPAADSDSSFWKIPNLGIDKALNEINHYGVSLHKYLFDISDKESFLNATRKAFDTCPEGILIAPAFHEEACQIAEICVDKEIPFAFFNSNPGNLGQISFIGQDARQSGMVAAQLMDFGLQDGSEILIVSVLRFLKNNKHILSRNEGFKEYYNRKKDKRIGLKHLNIDSLNMADVYDALRETFSANQDIKGIFVSNSRVFQVARFIETEKLTNRLLIGYDLTDDNIPYLQKGIISFLINQKPIEQTYRSIMALFSKIVLKKEIQEEILLPIDIVTKENLKYYEEY